MANPNSDMHTAAHDLDAEQLKELAEYGAWMECTLANDARKDTPLHRAFRNCPDYAEYEAEAARLRIKKDPIGKDYLVLPFPREGYPKVRKSGLKSLCKTEYQRW